MEDLIKSLQIFLVYGNPRFPTHCEHDLLHVDIDPKIVIQKDKDVLEELGFFENEEMCGFDSFRFGSC